ncbi:MAG: chloride channel protein [Clostridia bacterium]|nr:chloride channel protein [Clostridia bacterium]
MKKGVKHFGKKARLGAEIVAVGALTGLFAGVVITCFIALCTLAEKFARNDFYGFFRENPAFIPLLFFALFAGSILIGTMMRFLPSVKGSGIPQTEGATRGLFRFKWYEAITGMFAAALFTIFMGLNAGSEGPSIMIGGGCGSLTNDLLRRNAIVRRYQVTSGACAGISVAFNAPFTGMAFAFEEAHKRFTPEVFVSSFSSVVVAIIVRNLLGPLMGLKVGAFFTTFSFEGVESFNLMFLVYVLFAAVIIALCGVAFYYLILLVKKMFERSKLTKFAKGLFRVSIPFVLAGALGLITAYAMGGGHSFIEAVGSKGELHTIFSSPVWATLLIVVILRLVSTVLNVGTGVPAGAFVPILAIGAGIGALLSLLCGAMGMDQAYSDALIMICMATFFATVVKSPITGIVMVVELTWSFTFLLPVVLGVATGYLMGALFRTEPIYDKLLDDMLEEMHKTHPVEQFITKVRVTEKGHAAGRTLRDVLWPHGALVVRILRGEEEISPDGNTHINEGDILVVRGKTAEKKDFLESLVKTVGELVEEEPAPVPQEEIKG